MDIIQARVNKDKATLKKLATAGDDEQLVRLVDHSFSAESTDPLELMAECLRTLDFGDISISEAPDQDGYLLECTSIDCTEFHNIAKTSVLLALLSNQFEINYDGWGSEVAIDQQ